MPDYATCATLNGQPISFNQITGQPHAGGVAYSCNHGGRESRHDIPESIDELLRQDRLNRFLEQVEQLRADHKLARLKALFSIDYHLSRADFSDANKLGLKSAFLSVLGEGNVPAKVYAAIDKWQPERVLKYAIELIR